MVAYDMSNCREPWSLAPHDLDNNIPYLGGISTTTTSIKIVLFGYWTRDTHRSFIRPRHLTWLESNEKRSLYGLVMSKFNISMTDLGIKLCEAPESNIALCNILSCTCRLT